MLHGKLIKYICNLNVILSKSSNDVTLIDSIETRPMIALRIADLQQRLL